VFIMERISAARRPPIAPAQPSQGSLSDEIARLWQLKEQGAITEEEFANMKAATMLKHT
jgi:hypothetical protein